MKVKLNDAVFTLISIVFGASDIELIKYLLGGRLINHLNRLSFAVTEVLYCNILAHDLIINKFHFHVDEIPISGWVNLALELLFLVIYSEPIEE